MRIYGLIGKSLSHSFSQTYFNKKFKDLGLNDCEYHLFELENISKFDNLLVSNPNLKGINVTIPYKEEVLPFLDRMDDIAEKIGAVNTIYFHPDGVLCGYNTDYFGFKQSLVGWIWSNKIKAIVLGTGGASKAVTAALTDLNIPFQQVSRSSKTGIVTYEQLRDERHLLSTHKLVVNTTPLGMYPDTEDYPDIDYNLVKQDHFLYDLVYNPSTTSFMKKGIQAGAKVKNGQEMLHLQAEKAWKIWCS